MDIHGIGIPGSGIHGCPWEFHGSPWIIMELELIDLEVIEVHGCPVGNSWYSMEFMEAEFTEAVHGGITWYSMLFQMNPWDPWGSE